MLVLIVHFIDRIQPVVITLCLITAWGFVLILGSSVIAMVVDVIQRAKQMHKIPCSDCQYFTNDYRLKCSVHPFQASTEEAINCQDYQMREN